MIVVFTLLLCELCLLPDDLEVRSRQEPEVAAQDEDQLLGVAVLQGQRDVLQREQGVSFTGVVGLQRIQREHLIEKGQYKE